MRYELQGDWRLSFTAPDGVPVSMAATVPGNVEIDLERAGLLADCMPADDVHAHDRWTLVDDWTYSLAFDAPAFSDGWTRSLVFEGIDTVADVYLNGERVYEARDMFTAHRIDVAGLLLPRNELRVVIRSSELWAREQEYDVFGASRSHTFYASQPYLRKARHEWGWDNAPRLLTAGLYRAVYLESLPPVRFDDVYLYTARVSDDAVSLGIQWSFVTPDADISGYRLHTRLVSGGRVAYDDVTEIDFVRGALRFAVPRAAVALWWPYGFGEPNLSDVTLTLTKGGEPVAEWSSKWGIRTLRLERTEDIADDGTGEFVFVVNNERVYINGTNWKPLDALHSRADAKVSRALALVRDLHCNMVRIWGGGIYEDTPFFDECDRTGLMVWQDFMFGCEFPPRDADYRARVADETAAIVRKFRNHASLAVWCGDNEDDECLTWTHPDASILPSDNLISRETLRECVLRYDPYRSYCPSSPYNSDANIRDRRAGKVTHYQPEAHLYPPTASFAASLRACRSRFIGETGPIIVNAMTDNARIFAREAARAERLWDAPLDPAHRNLLAHQRDDYFMSWRQTGKELCQARYGRDFAFGEWRDYCLAVNLICADVFKDVIEYCRTGRWERTGVIWWSLMDMWPMLFNYSVVDCDFRPKLPYYWIRQSQQPFALMAVRREVGGEIALYSANDTLARHAGDYTVTELAPDGSERVIASGRYDEAANNARLLQRLPACTTPALWLIAWREDGVTRYNHFAVTDGVVPFEVWRGWNARLGALYGVSGE